MQLSLNNLLVIVALILLLSGCRGQAPAAQANDDAYNFPTKPGTEAWKQLASRQEMLQAVQIPEATLETMSTKGLVKTVLNYPLLSDMLAHLQIQSGFDAVVKDFNGLAALLNRPDAGRELLARYQAMDPAAVAPNATLLQQGQYDAQFTAIEMLLAQEPILKQLSSQEVRELLAETVTKMDAKQQHTEIYGQFGQERTALVMARSLQQHAADLPCFEVLKAEAEVSAFLEDANQASPAATTKIADCTREFIK